MGLAADIRQKLPMCSDCINCKLVVWNGEAEISKSSHISKVKINDDQNIFFMVRCSWLKTAITEPLNLTVCEGKIAQSKGNN